MTIVPKQCVCKFTRLRAVRAATARLLLLIPQKLEGCQHIKLVLFRLPELPSAYVLPCKISGDFLQLQTVIANISLEIDQGMLEYTQIGTGSQIHWNEIPLERNPSRTNPTGTKTVVPLERIFTAQCT